MVLERPFVIAENCGDSSFSGGEDELLKPGGGHVKGRAQWPFSRPITAPKA